MAPVVSVVIPTYLRPDILMDCAVRSVRSQAFTDWECIVVGDGTDDLTVERMTALCAEDPRFRFVNLPRTELPDDPSQRWAVAGLVPINHGLDLATGEYVLILCDDDELTSSALADLCREARRYVGDFIFGQSITDTGALYGNRAEPFDIPQGSYILRRSLGYRADPACVTKRRTWDGDFMERVLSGNHRVVRVTNLVHLFHQGTVAHAVDWR